jgi:hypothetical protein
MPFLILKLVKESLPEGTTSLFESKKNDVETLYRVTLSALYSTRNAQLEVAGSFPDVKNAVKVAGCYTFGCDRAV